MEINLLQYGGGTVAFPAAATYTFEDPFSAIGAKELEHIMLQLKYTQGTAGGTTIDVFLQTSFDKGATWWDVINLFHATTTVAKAAAVKKYIGSAVRTAAVDGTLADDTIFDGFFGHDWRIKIIVVGAYNIDNVLRVDASVQVAR